jgi:hypothetical protein
LGRRKIKKYIYKSPESEARARANLRRGRDSGSIEKIITKTKRLRDLDIIGGPGLRCQVRKIFYSLYMRAL